ncbi:MAG: hypothetical protein AB7U20_24345 [Planctomycetaceae bacterium]
MRACRKQQPDRRDFTDINSSIGEAMPLAAGKAGPTWLELVEN